MNQKFGKITCAGNKAPITYSSIVINNFAQLLESLVPIYVLNEIQHFELLRAGGVTIAG